MNRILGILSNPYVIVLFIFVVLHIVNITMVKELPHLDEESYAEMVRKREFTAEDWEREKRMRGFIVLRKEAEAKTLAEIKKPKE